MINVQKELQNHNFSSNFRIVTPKSKSKMGSKASKNRLKLFIGIGSGFIFKKLCHLLIFLIISGCAFNSSCPKKPINVKNFLSSISLEERIMLDYFFRCLILEDSIGYVLLGGKPMSFHSRLKTKSIIDSLHIHPLERIHFFFNGFDDTLFYKGWEIWKKYESQFCGKNIFFDLHEENGELHFTKIIVINKKLLTTVINGHLNKFKEIDSSIKDFNKAFQALLYNQEFKRKFYERHDLVGISLGYGEKNACLFQKMYLLHKTMRNQEYILKNPYQASFKRLEKKCKQIENCLTSFKTSPTRKFSFNLSLNFRADYSDPETIALQEKYAKYKKLLTKNYLESNFLEKTLELIYHANEL